MKSWLIMQAADGSERKFPLAKPRMVIGRETTADVRVPIPSVERRHCEITSNNGSLLLQDLGSQHGTFHNGVRVTEAPLAHADHLAIGPVTFIVRIEQDEDDGHMVSEIVIERELTAAPPIPAAPDGHATSPLPNGHGLVGDRDPMDQPLAG